MATLNRADIARMPDTPGKARLIAALDFADKAAARQEQLRIEALPDLPVHATKPAKAEKALQCQCEGILACRGYRRLTGAEAVAVDKGGEVKGWFGHLQKPIGNPFYPDLMIYTPKMDRCLGVELKVRNEYQEGQAEMIRFGAWKVCFSFDEFLAVVEAWEDSEWEGQA